MALAPLDERLFEIFKEERTKESYNRLIKDAERNNNRELMLKLVAIEPKALADVSENLKNDEEIVLLAIKQNLSLKKHAGKAALQSESVKKAIQEHEMAAEEVRNIKKAIMKAYINKQIKLENVHPSLFSDWYCSHEVIHWTEQRIFQYKTKYESEIENAMKSGKGGEELNKVNARTAAYEAKIAESKKWPPYEYYMSLEQVNKLKQELEKSLKLSMQQGVGKE